MSESEHRPINKAVGLNPKFGSLSIYQLGIMGGIAIPLYYLKEFASLPLLPIAILWGLSSGLLLALVGEKPWLFVNRITHCPHAIRGGAYYYPLLAQEEEYVQSKRERRRKKLTV